MSKVFQTVLLLALPASGKSEVRNFMTHMDAARLASEFHIGENVQLDDFPYVHMMRQIDDILEELGEARLYYRSSAEPFLHNEDWGTLVELLNEDYEDLMHCRREETASYARHLFARIDAASEKAGCEARLRGLSAQVLQTLCDRLEADARTIQKEKEAQYREDYSGMTFVIEAARGGPDGSTMPLTGAYGYQYTLPVFSDAILDHAAILYIQVTPEESRRKNAERANPDDPGSNLFHGVPMAVMLGDYGCDDMPYLIAQSEVKDTVTVRKKERVWHLPVGVFDNRVDKTSFLRADESEWDAAAVEEVTQGIRNATDAMWGNYSQ